MSQKIKSIDTRFQVTYTSRGNTMELLERKVDVKKSLSTFLLTSTGDIWTFPIDKVLLARNIVDKVIIELIYSKLRGHQ